VPAPALSANVTRLPTRVTALAVAPLPPGAPGVPLAFMMNRPLSLAGASALITLKVCVVTVAVVLLLLLLRSLSVSFGDTVTLAVLTMLAASPGVAVMVRVR